MIVRLEVLSRKGCPYRSFPDESSDGWGPQVPWCNHPKRTHSWCPNKPDQRSDDPTPDRTPFPPLCPLEPDELVKHDRVR